MVSPQEAIYLVSAGAECLDSTDEDIEWMLDDMVEKEVIFPAMVGLLRHYMYTVREEKGINNAKKDS